MEPVFVDGQRVTDAATLEVAGMVLVGKVNKDIVGLINSARRHGRRPLRAGRPADPRRSSRSTATSRATRSTWASWARSKSIDTSVLDLLADEMIPVVASVGADDDGQVYNINADTVAGELAAAVGAEKIVFLTDVGGILEDDGYEQSVVSECDLAYLGALQGAGKISGGMLPKVAAVRRALEGGVAQRPHRRRPRGARRAARGADRRRLRHQGRRA